jgi:tetratricopeptide (TPR) repeat protein
LLELSLLRPLDGDTVELHGLVGAATLRYVNDQASFVTTCAAGVSGQLAAQLGDVENVATHAPHLRLAAFGQALALRSSAADDGFDLDTLQALGRFLHVQERYEEAAELERRAVAKAAAGGESSRRALTLQSNLAISLAHVGRRTEAVELLSRLSARLEAEFGPDDIDTLTVQHNLANQLLATDSSRARQLAVDVYRRRLGVLGPDHPHTLFSVHSLLSQDVVPPGYASAVEAYRDLIERRTRILGENHTTTLTSMLNFAQRLSRTGDPEAEHWARRALEGRAAVYGNDHPATTNARLRWLQALASLHEPPADEIRTLLAQLDDTIKRSSDVEAVADLATLGELLRRNGRADQAVEVLGRALRLPAAAAQPDALGTLLATHNLVAAMADLGLLNAARTRSDALVPRLRRGLGADHRLSMRAERTQALVLARLGQVNGAVAAQEELATRWRTLAGEHSPEYAEALGDLAASYAMLDRPEDERRYLELQRRTGAAGDLNATGGIQT